jgi:hypothetical protein
MLAPQIAASRTATIRYNGAMAKMIMEMIMLAASIGFSIRATLILRTGTYTTRSDSQEKSDESTMYAIANYAASAAFLAMFLYVLFSK